MKIACAAHHPVHITNQGCVLTAYTATDQHDQPCHEVNTFIPGAGLRLRRDATESKGRARPRTAGGSKYPYQLIRLDFDLVTGFYRSVAVDLVRRHRPVAVLREPVLPAPGEALPVRRGRWRACHLFRPAVSSSRDRCCGVGLIEQFVSRIPAGGAATAARPDQGVLESADPAHLDGVKATSSRTRSRRSLPARPARLRRRGEPGGDASRPGRRGAMVRACRRHRGRAGPGHRVRRRPRRSRAARAGGRRRAPMRSSRSTTGRCCPRRCSRWRSWARSTCMARCCRNTAAGRRRTGPCCRRDGDRRVAALDGRQARCRRHRRPAGRAHPPGRHGAAGVRQGHRRCRSHPLRDRCRRYGRERRRAPRTTSPGAATSAPAGPRTDGSTGRVRRPRSTT